MKGIAYTKENYFLIQQGVKDCTRRLISGAINDDPDSWVLHGTGILDEDSDWQFPKSWVGKHASFFQFKDAWYKIEVPRYQPKEVLYLKEPYIEVEEGLVLYKHDGLVAKFDNPRFMPQRLARRFIRIESVKPERLWDITEQEARREGIVGDTETKDYVKDSVFQCHTPTLPNYVEQGKLAVASYFTEFQHIHSKAILESNPWVWVYHFKPFIP